MAKKSSKPTKQLSGGARMALAGRKPILLGATTAEHKKLTAAAKIDNLRLTQFLMRYGLMAADRILEKSGK